MKKILIIFNPVSGLNHLRRDPEATRRYLDENGIAYTWFETIDAPAQPFETIRFDAHERIIVIGGDGTIRNVAQYLIDHDIRIPLGIVAQGSGNALAISLGIPLFPLQRCLQYALSTRPKPLDAIRINKEHCALIGAGQGYDSVLFKGATRALKKRFGLLAYVLTFFRTYFFERSRVFRLVIDGRRHTVMGKVVLVINALALAGIPLDRAIAPDDGLLNVIVLNPRTFWDMLRIAGCLVIRRPFHRMPTIQSFVGRTISVAQRKGKRIQLDGDVMRAKNMQVEVLPGALDVAYGK